MRFEHPWYLIGLVLVPILWLAIRLYKTWQQQRRAIWGSNLGHVVSNYNPKHVSWQLYSTLLAFTLLTLAAANPQKGNGTETIKSEGLNVILALDISKSMYAEDIAPNRLENAKHFIRKLVEINPGNRYGLVVFAGSAFIQVPLTNDYATLLNIMEETTPEIISEQGTAIADAIELVGNFGKNETSGARRVALIISDGEDHQGEAIAKAKSINEEDKLTIYTLGVGSVTGAPIPITTPFGELDYVADEEGKKVLSRLNPEALNQIAEAGGGYYFSLASFDSSLKGLTDQFNKLEKGVFEERKFNSYNSYFQYPLFLALLLLALPYLRHLMGFGLQKK